MKSIVHCIHDSKNNCLVTDEITGESQKWYCIGFGSPNVISFSDGSIWHRDGIPSCGAKQLQDENTRLRAALNECQDALEEHGITITQNKINTELEKQLQQENSELRQEVIITLSEKQTLRDQVELLENRIKSLQLERHELIRSLPDED